VGIKYNQDGKLSSSGESSSTITNIEIGPNGGSGSSIGDTPFSSSMDIHQTGVDIMTLENSNATPSASGGGKKSKALGLFNPTYAKRDSTVNCGKDQLTSSENLVMDNIELDSGPFNPDASDEAEGVDLGKVFSSSGEKEKSKKFLFKKTSKKKGIAFFILFYSLQINSF
jgi:hypothetical protein